MSNNLITEVDICDEARENFLTYTEEVLTDRAVPSAEDGLLSVHRKLLWTMENVLKMTNKSKYKKSASVVGSTLASSYFHGDTACYGALCKLAQPYLMRYPLIDGDGNLGTQEGNGMEAAARYCVTGDTLIPTEAGLKKISDIAKDVPLNSEKDISLYVKGINGEKVLAEKIVNSGEHETYILTLANGQRIQTTSNHPLMILNDCLQMEWKTVGELQEKDKVLYPLFKDNQFGFGKYNDLYEAAMLGCMISKGYATTQNSIGINDKDMDMIIPVMKWVALNWGENLGCLTENNQRGYYEYSVASKEHFTSFVNIYSFEKSKEKKLPKIFFDGTREYQKTLISYLFEGNGSVDSNHGISYSSISEELIRQLQLVLQMNFGIFSSIIFDKTRNEIKLQINKASSERFQQQINFVSKRKQAKLQDYIIEYNKRWGNNNLQNIEEINLFLRKNYPCRSNHSHIKSLNEIKDIVFSEQYEKIEYLLSNYITLAIVKKEKVLEKQPVYCFTINNNDHAFIGGGLINHNTNAKPSKYADLMMSDFNKNVVPLKETYNGEYMEPVVLPSAFPNAMANGRETIAIGLAHNSLPHNVKEVCDAIIARIKKGTTLTVDELMEYIKAPDFPLENTIINSKDIREAFATGRSSTSLKVRGKYRIVKDEIIFDTIPYRTYRNKIKEQIAKNVDALEAYIEDFSDESNVGVNKLVFKVKKGVNPEQAVLKLFALTDLQTTLSYNMNFIVNGTPKMCSMMDLVDAYVTHQTEVLLKATQYDRNKAAARAHILEGLLLILTNIDKAVSLIRKSADKNEAEKKLIAEFGIDSEQAKAVLDMKLAKLTKLDKDDLMNELKAKQDIVAECDKIINDENHRNEVLIGKVETIKVKYGDARRTEVLNIEVPKEEKEIAEVVPEDVVVIMSKSGNIKRIPKSSFKTQRRNGKGVKSADDAILDTISTNTIDTLMIFTNKGKMYRLLVDNVPTGTNVSKGQNISGILKMESDEEVEAITSLFRKTNAEYVVFFTKNGLIKKTKLEEFTKTKKTTGIQAIKLKEGDSLVGVSFLKDEDVIVITKKGMSIHFSTTDISPIGRVACGVKAIKLDDNDEVIVGLPTKANNYLAVFTKNGLGKITDISEYNRQGRGGKGIYTYKPTPATGDVVGAAIVDKTDNILIIGKPSSICIAVSDMPILSRTGLGNIMVKESKIQNIVKL